MTVLAEWGVEVRGPGNGTPTTPVVARPGVRGTSHSPVSGTTVDAPVGPRVVNERGGFYSNGNSTSEGPSFALLPEPGPGDPRTPFSLSRPPVVSRLCGDLNGERRSYRDVGVGPSAGRVLLPATSVSDTHGVRVVTGGLGGSFPSFLQFVLPLPRFSQEAVREEPGRGRTGVDVRGYIVTSLQDLARQSDDDPVFGQSTEDVKESARRMDEDPV